MCVGVPVWVAPILRRPKDRIKCSILHSSSKIPEAMVCRIPLFATVCWARPTRSET